MGQNLRSGACLVVAVALLCLLLPGQPAVVHAAYDNDVQSAGIATVIGLDADFEFGKLLASAADEITTQDPGETNEEIAADDEGFGYVIANADSFVNIREQPDENAVQIGVMYRDNGGRILARDNGWTKIQTGNLIGWAKDEYLYFDDEAEAAAKEVGKAAVIVVSDVLRVRAGAGEDEDVLGVAVRDEKLIVKTEEENGWIGVEYGEATGYVLAEYVDDGYHLDEGETLAQIKKREKEEEERKAREAAEKAAAEAAALKAAQEKAAAEAAAKARSAQQAAPVVAAGGNDTLLLAALIYCEAGNQPHNGKVAVGNVVMNRVRSGAYPSTIYNVIYQPGQFGPARTGKVAAVLNSGRIPQDCITAASEALAGAAPVGGATQFRRAGAHAGTVIGGHVFW